MVLRLRVMPWHAMVRHDYYYFSFHPSIKTILNEIVNIFGGTAVMRLKADNCLYGFCSIDPVIFYFSVFGYLTTFSFVPDFYALYLLNC